MGYGLTPAKEAETAGWTQQERWLKRGPENDRQRKIGARCPERIGGRMGAQKSLRADR